MTINNSNKQKALVHRRKSKMNVVSRLLHKRGPHDVQFLDVRGASRWVDQGEGSALLLLTHMWKEQKTGKSSSDSLMGNKEAVPRLHCSLLYLECSVLLIRGV